ncbi:MAG: hypothetical protein V1776_05355 [Candidatus Diapherotrites archaeon]
MNVFKLLITAIIAIALVGIIFFDFASYFTQNENLNAHTRTALLEAQADLGTAKNITLSVKKEQTLYARSLDEPTRTVAFACSTSACCSTFNECTQPLSVTPERMKVNQSIQTTISARCEKESGIHICKVYFGKAPAQLQLIETSIPKTISIDEDNQLISTITVQNTGEVAGGEGNIVFELKENQIFAGKEEWVTIHSQEAALESILPKEKKEFTFTGTIPQKGKYQVVIHATATESGSINQTFDITATGEGISLCKQDYSQKENPTFDGISNKCQLKRFCTGCHFAYECKDAWSNVPMTGGAYYDNDGSQPNYVYVYYDLLPNGTC